MLKFNAKLDAASEVPAKTSAGTGTLEATLDMASKTLTYSGLTGPAAKFAVRSLRNSNRRARQAVTPA